MPITVKKRRPKNLKGGIKCPLELLGLKPKAKYVLKIEEFLAIRESSNSVKLNIELTQERQQKLEHI